MMTAFSFRKYILGASLCALSLLVNSPMKAMEDADAAARSRSPSVSSTEGDIEWDITIMEEGQVVAQSCLTDQSHIEDSVDILGKISNGPKEFLDVLKWRTPSYIVSQRARLEHVGPQISAEKLHAAQTILSHLEQNFDRAAARAAFLQEIESEAAELNKPYSAKEQKKFCTRSSLMQVFQMGIKKDMTSWEAFLGQYVPYSPEEREKIGAYYAGLGDCSKCLQDLLDQPLPAPLDLLPQRSNSRDPMQLMRDYAPYTAEEKAVLLLGKRQLDENRAIIAPFLESMEVHSAAAAVQS